MKKKYLAILAGLLVVGLVSAGVLQYFGQIKQEVTSNQAVVLSKGDTICGNSETGTPCTETGDIIISGQQVTSDIYTLTSKANVDIPIRLTTTVLENGETPQEDGITTRYMGVLELSGKSACYAEGDCLLDDEPKATVYYTIVGSEFIYRVESEDIDVNDYTLVYYPDIEGYDSADYTGYVIPADEIVESLPMNNDLNKVDDEYCTNDKNPEGVNCYGAKLWLVLTNDINGNYIVGWSGDSYLFETDLITYTDNELGEIEIKAGEALDFYVETTFGFNNVGTYEITTEAQIVV